MSSQHTKNKINIVSVFGSSKLKDDHPDYQEAVVLGKLLAENGFTVCSGGYRGIMEAASRGAGEAGGKTIGVTTSQFKGTVNSWIQEERSTPTWKDRLFSLIDTADAYVVCTGGTGTLVELFVCWEMMSKKMAAKPIIVVGKFFRTLLETLKQEPLVIFNDQLRVAHTPEEVIGILKSI